MSDLRKIIIDETEIANKVTALAAEIAATLPEVFTAVGVLFAINQFCPRDGDAGRLVPRHVDRQDDNGNKSNDSGPKPRKPQHGSHSIASQRDGSTPIRRRQDSTVIVYLYLTLEGFG